MKRILHVGVGPLGQNILKDLYSRDIGHLIAAVDPAPHLADQPLSEFVPGADEKIRILPSLDAFDQWDDIDAAIVATSSDLRLCHDTFVTLLEHGKAVVSTCEELLYPWLRHVALADELDEIAKSNGGRLLGTGVNPGFLMDTLAVAATAVCRDVTAVECHRIQDASTRRVPFQKKIGAAQSEEQFAANVKAGTLRHVGLGESLHFIAHYLGLDITRWEEDINPVRAEKVLNSAIGPIPAGGISGVRQTARGWCDGKEVVSMVFQAAIGQANPHDRVIIHGEPPIDMTITNGVHGDVATSAIVINAVPRLLRAEPGLHTMASLPMVRFMRPDHDPV